MRLGYGQFDPALRRRDQKEMRAVLLLILISSLFPSAGIAANPLHPGRSAAAIIEKVNQNILKIKDASMDITLDYTLFIFGCSGLNRMKGKGYYKSPDKIKATLNHVTYFAKGNKIRKIDAEGKRFYLRLLHSLDFTPGFHAGLIPYNFFLTVIKDDPDEISIEGIPKPGILKNVEKVVFYIDPKEYLLRKLDLTLVNKNLSGTININYQKIQGLWVPVSFYGRTAIEIRDNALVGIGIKLKGENFKINNGLSDKLFDPGF